MRPDYVHCIKYSETKRTSFCERKLIAEFAFVDIDHAVNAAIAGSRLMICPNCWKKILETVKDNIYKPVPDPAKRIVETLKKYPRARVRVWFWNDGEINRARIENPDRLKSERSLVSKVGVYDLIQRGILRDVSVGVDQGQGKIYRLEEEQ